MIPPKASASFVANMEDVLAVYEKPYDPAVPVVCVDEGGKPWIGEVRPPLPVGPGSAARQDSECRRAGVANRFIAFEPRAGRREVAVTQRKTKADFAAFLRRLSDEHSIDAQRIVLVLDHLSTHRPAAFYEAFPPEEARRLAQRFEWHYTPKHGSWLNVAELELSVLARQCLDRRIPDLATLEDEVEAWRGQRNDANVRVHWQFTTADARIKLRKLYPTIEMQ